MKSFRQALLAVALMLCIPMINLYGEGRTIQINTGKVNYTTREDCPQKDFSNETDSTYTFTVRLPSGGYEFTQTPTCSQSSWTLAGAKGGTSATATLNYAGSKTDSGKNINLASFFSVTIDGYYAKPGPGPGDPYHFNATADHLGVYYIEPEKAQVDISEGSEENSETFTSKLNSSTVPSEWTVTKGGNTVATGSGSSYTYTPTETGRYKVKGKHESDDNIFTDEVNLDAFKLLIEWEPPLVLGVGKTADNIELSLEGPPGCEGIYTFSIIPDTDAKIAGNAEITVTSDEKTKMSMTGLTASLFIEATEIANDKNSVRKGFTVVELAPWIVNDYLLIGDSPLTTLFFNLDPLDLNIGAFSFTYTDGYTLSMTDDNEQNNKIFYDLTKEAVPIWIDIKALTGETGIIDFNFVYDGKGGAGDPDGYWVKTAKVSVPVYNYGIDLEIAGIDKTLEDTPGGFIAINQNDTPTNMHQIILTPQGIEFPNDLKGVLTLKLASGANNVRVWNTPNPDGNTQPVFGVGGTAPNNTLQWVSEQDGIPEQIVLYVEGVKKSILRGIKFDASYNISRDENVVLSNVDSISQTIFITNVEIQNLGEDKEEDPGAVISLNVDDDNRNGTSDKDDNTSGVTGEDDLVEVKLSLLPNGTEAGLKTLKQGIVTLSKIRLNNPQTGGNARFWADTEKNNEPDLLIWDFSKNEEMPANLYLEGTIKSIVLRDVEVNLAYVGQTSCLDKVLVTVFNIDMDIKHPRNFSGRLLSDEKELDPGVLIMVNDDFDGKLKDANGNPLPDNSDEKINGTRDRNDMANLILRKLMKNLPVGGKIYIKKKDNSGDGEVRIFENNTTVLLNTSKNTSIDEIKAKAIFTALKRDISYWVEGLESGELILVMEYQTADGAVAGMDEIKITIVKLDLDVDSNNNNGYENPDRNPEEDKIEEDTPGKFFQVNNADVDNDGILDFCDGFDASSKILEDNLIVFRETLPRLIPIVLEFNIPTSVVDSKDIEYTFKYTASLPSRTRIKLIKERQTKKIIAYKCTAPAGFRLWMHNGKLRKKNFVTDNGHFIPSGKKLTAEQIDMLQGVQTFYLEATPGSEKYIGNKTLITLTAKFKTKSGQRITIKDKVRVKPVKIDIAMDGDRDTKIKFTDPEDSKYLFWVNDDHDYSEFLQTEWKRVEDDTAGTPDCNDNTIGTTTEWGKQGCKRDLEDFTRLHLQVPDSLTELDGITYHFQMNGVSEANIFEAVERKKERLYGNADYLKVLSVADNQITKKRLLTISSSEAKLNAQYIRKNDKKSCFLLEGKETGSGQIIFIIKKDGLEIARRSVKLELRYPEYFFETFEVSSVGSASVPDGTYKDDFVKKDDYLLFVHGFNVSTLEKRTWGGTVFKRLWWQGYRGHVGFFDWPCVTTSWTSPTPKAYDNSDYNAWRCGTALKNRLVALNSGKHKKKVRVIAHSQGNIITGEALKQAPNNILHTYIATQAAIAGDCYQKNLWPYYFDYTTPNVRAKYPGSNKPYLTGIRKKAKRRYSYYNVQDWALTSAMLPITWEDNNKMRPDFNYWYTEGDGKISTYNPSKGDRFYRGIPYVHEVTLLIPANTYEIFAYNAEARSKALGALKTVTGFSRYNLQTLGYNKAHYSHSRQFRSNIVDEWKYWARIISNAKLPKK